MKPDHTLSAHLELLSHHPKAEEIDEIRNAPLFTPSTRDNAIRLLGGAKPFPQYGLLAGDAEGPAKLDPRIFYNTSVPSSVFICGSQGSGKSHTLSCLLENCLIKSRATVLPHPLTGIVFHYDTFVSEKGGSACEAAYLSSSLDIKVRVLCAPTNINNIRNIYKHLPNVHVEELRIRESDLNTKRMLDLMAANSSEGPVPLYIHTIKTILREMRLQQQERGSVFNYQHFLRMIENADLLPAQNAPLKQRLETLQSFMVKEQVVTGSLPVNTSTGRQMSAREAKNMMKNSGKGNDWAPKAGHLTIIDLTCPCITPEVACSLFNISLSLFLEQTPSPTAPIGRVIALDEAHKYLSASSTTTTTSSSSVEAKTLTASLLTCIREQRHIAARIFIATQEPTIAPALLDLCSVTIVHRFSSPGWMASLKDHIAGVSGVSRMVKKAEDSLADLGSASIFDHATPALSPSSASGGYTTNSPSPSNSNNRDAMATLTTALSTLTLSTTDPALDVFAKIVGLRRGEALVFAPSAVLDVFKSMGDSIADGGRKAGHGIQVSRLEHGVLKVRVRARVTEDGGASVMAL